MIRHSCPTLGAEEADAVRRVIESRQVGGGVEVEAFEKEFAELLGVRHAVAVNSGSSALHVALIAAGIEKGSRVAIPSYICAAVLNAVSYTGATPVLLDVDETTLGIGEAAFKKALKRGIDAVIVNHAFGKTCQVEPFRKAGIVIEDCAAAAGSRVAGSKGDLAIFSFYATKMLTTGHGGMVVTNSDKLARNIVDAVDYDKRAQYRKRYNYRMSAVNAAIGRVQLARLHGFITRRLEIADYSYRNLRGLGIGLPLREENVFHRFVLDVGTRADELIEFMSGKGIECKRPVFKPLHAYFKMRPKDFPVTERVFRSRVSIPIYPSLAENEMEYVVSAVRSFAG